MSGLELRALNNAAASSAMEGLPLDEKDLLLITNILEGKDSLQNFLQSLSGYPGLLSGAKHGQG